MHIPLSVSGPESLCLDFGRSTLWHTSVQICYPLEIGREFCSPDDLIVNCALEAKEGDGWGTDVRCCDFGRDDLSDCGVETTTEEGHLRLSMMNLKMN